MRLTEEFISKTLKDNEGFQDRTYYSSRNYEGKILYTIFGGKLFKQLVGKKPWSDSRFVKADECDLEETKRFLRTRWRRLNFDE